MVMEDKISCRNERIYRGSVQKYFEPTMRRAFRFGQRWDEGLWRVLELAAVDVVLQDNDKEPILDVGCGNGDVFAAVFGKGRKSYGIDLAWLDVQAAQDANVYSSCSVGDGRHLAFKDGQFALAFANSVFEHVDHIEVLLGEIARVLESRGRLIFTTPSPTFRDKEYYYWRKALGDLGLDFVGRRIGRREDSIYHHISVHSFPEWKNLLERAGFRDVHHYEYIPPQTALLISRYSGAVRVPGLRRLTKLSSDARDCFCPPDSLTEDQWLEWYRTALAPYLNECRAGEAGAGLAIIANK